MQAIAEDWNEELKDYPAWALQKASRWWMSRNNEKRRQKPIAGDIAARAQWEMGVIRVAEGSLRRFDTGSNSAKPRAVRRSPPNAAQKAEADRLTEQFARRAGLKGGDV